MHQKPRAPSSPPGGCTSAEANIPLQDSAPARIGAVTDDQSGVEQDPCLTQGNTTPFSPLNGRLIRQLSIGISRPVEPPPGAAAGSRRPSSESDDQISSLALAWPVRWARERPPAAVTVLGGRVEVKTAKYQVCKLLDSDFTH